MTEAQPLHDMSERAQMLRASHNPKKPTLLFAIDRKANAARYTSPDIVPKIRELVNSVLESNGPIANVYLLNEESGNGFVRDGISPYAIGEATDSLGNTYPALGLQSQKENAFGYVPLQMLANAHEIHMPRMEGGWTEDQMRIPIAALGNRIAVVRTNFRNNIDDWSGKYVVNTTSVNELVRGMRRRKTRPRTDGSLLAPVAESAEPIRNILISLNVEIHKIITRLIEVEESMHVYEKRKENTIQSHWHNLRTMPARSSAELQKENLEKELRELLLRRLGFEALLANAEDYA